jgi:hypothetical protein
MKKNFNNYRINLTFIFKIIDLIERIRLYQIKIKMIKTTPITIKFKIDIKRIRKNSIKKVSIKMFKKLHKDNNLSIAKKNLVISNYSIEIRVNQLK